MEYTSPKAIDRLPSAISSALSLEVQNLGETVSLLTDMLNILPDGCITVDPNFRIIYANAQAASDFLGSNSYLGSLIWEQLEDYHGADVRAIIERAMAERTSSCFRHTVHTEIGRAVRSTYYAIYPDEARSGLHLVYRDISKERQDRDKLSESLTLLSAVIDGTEDYVLAKGLDCRYVLVNKAAAESFGLSSPAEVIGLTDLELFDSAQFGTTYQQIKRSDDTVIQTGKSIKFEMVNERAAANGQFKVELVTKSPLRDPHTGITFGVVTIVHDITERKVRERREEFFHELTDRMRLLRDADEIILDVLKSIQQFMNASRCAYVQVNEETQTMEMRHECLRNTSITSRVELSISIFGETFASTLRRGHALVVDDLSQVEDANYDRNIFTSYNIRSTVDIPIHHNGAWVGILIVNDDVPRNWDINDVEMLRLVVDRTWLTLENARLFKELQTNEARQRNIADTLQTSLILPSQINAFPGVEIDAHYEAALSEAEIGGDYGDAFRLDKERVALLVGDCTGKGLEAARFVSECQYSVRAFLRSHPDDPAQALTLLNEMLLAGQENDNRPRTALTCLTVAVINLVTGEALVTAGGAEPPLVFRANAGTAEPVQVSGSLIGAYKDVDFDTVRLVLDPGDMIILLTDGMTEARRQKTRELYGFDRLLESVESVAPTLETIRGFAKGIVRHAKDFAGGILTDDTCVLVARRATA